MIPNNFRYSVITPPVTPFDLSWSAPITGANVNIPTSTLFKHSQWDHDCKYSRLFGNYDPPIPYAYR